MLILLRQIKVLQTVQSTKRYKGWQHFSLPNVHLSQRYRRVGGGGGHLPLIGRSWSRDQDTGPWLVEADYSVAGEIW